jgi:hypothetical protein
VRACFRACVRVQNYDCNDTHTKLLFFSLSLTLTLAASLSNTHAYKHAHKHSHTDIPWLFSQPTTFWALGGTTNLELVLERSIHLWAPGDVIESLLTRRSVMLCILVKLPRGADCISDSYTWAYTGAHARRHASPPYTHTSCHPYM